MQKEDEMAALRAEIVRLQTVCASWKAEHDYYKNKLEDRQCKACVGTGHGWHRSGASEFLDFDKPCLTCGGAGFDPEPAAKALRRAGYFVSRDGETCTQAIRDLRASNEHRLAVYAVMAEQGDK